MTYVLPQPLIFQDFELSIAPVQRRLNAFLMGPHAQLLRYDEAEDKAQIGLGTYDHLGVNVDGDFKTCYPWPAKPPGADIDPTFVKLFIDDALLRIFQDSSHTMEKTSANKVTHPNINFADNGDDYPRDPALLRDIQVGDVVTIKGSSLAPVTEHTLYTYVKDIEGDPVAAIVSAPVAEPANAEDQTASAVADDPSGGSGDVLLTSVDGSTYDGTDDGDVTEVYTIEVIQASTDSNPSTARLRVVSASGRDDDLEQTPSAFVTPTPIGSRGLKVVFSLGDALNFALGDIWTVTVSQAWTSPVPTAGGTYVGKTDKKYIVVVTKGGKWGTSPQITVTTQDGTDFSGPTTVVPATAVPIGTFGVTINFPDASPGSGLCKGNRYVVDVNAAGEGDMKTLVLAHNIPAEIPLNDDAGAALEVSIYIKKNIQVPEKHAVQLGDVNWEATPTEFCVFGGIYATDDDWAEDGVPVPLPIITDPIAVGTNRLYVEYRAWLTTYSNTVTTFTSESDLDDMEGPASPDNPLKYGLLKALQNNNGQEVRFVAIANPEDLDSWLDALDLITDRNDIYTIVPLTYNPEVLASVAGHCESQSTELAARWRCAFFGLEGQTEAALATKDLSSDGEVILATTVDDPSTSGTQHTMLAITSGNAELSQMEVKDGDIVRYQFRTDPWGDVTWNEYVIDEVINESTVRLATGTAIAEATPIKVEFWRKLSRDQQSVEVRERARQWDDRRIKCAWFNRTVGGQPVVANYYVAAAWAAAIGGVVPHQSLTRSTINGFAGVGGVENYFNRSQLDGMAENGVWLQVDDAQSGTIICRHAVTTADYTNIKFREEMYTRNVDSISYYFMSVFEPYIGKANATDAIIDVLEAEVLAGKEFLRRSGYTELLGGQLIDATIEDIRISPVFKDRVIIVMNCELPFPLNNIELHLVV